MHMRDRAENISRMSRKWGTALLGVALAWGLSTAPAAASAAGQQPFGIKDGVRGEEGQLLLQVGTLAGSGEPGDGDAAADIASLRAPQGVAVLPDGTVYIADTNNHQIRKLTGGKISTAAGLKFLTNELYRPIGGYNDGLPGESALNEPVGLAADASGNLYIADAGNHAIRKLSPGGRLTTLAGNGEIGDADGRGKDAGFYYPQAVAVDDRGNVYVADSLNHLIRRIAPDGNVTTLNESPTAGREIIPGLLVESGGYRDGKLAQALFNEPSGLALDAKGNLYVSDTGNQLIRYIDFASNTVSTVAGGKPDGTPDFEAGSIYATAGYADGAAANARFSFPRGLAVTPEGGLLIADSLNHAIRYLYEGKVSTIAGAGDSVRGWLDGIESSHALQAPSAVALAPGGELLAADSYNNRIRSISLLRLPERREGDTSVRIVTGAAAEELKTPSKLLAGRTFAPVRAVTESLGYEVDYKPDTREVLLRKGQLDITLQLDSKEAEVRRNGGEAETVMLDAAPFVQNGVSYIPVRYISELIELDVQWHAASRTVIIRSPITDGEEL